MFIPLRTNMDAILGQFDELKSMWRNKRQLSHQALTLCIVVLTALMTWKGLIVYTNSESPIVVVLRWVSTDFLVSAPISAR